MTPTIGWLMTVVAVVAITALALSIRRSRRGSPDMNDSRPGGPGSPQPSLISVKVEMECKDDHDFKVKVDPWTVRVRRGHTPEVEWELDGPDGSTMEIKAKNAGQWPLAGSLPGKVPPNHPLKGGKVRPGAAPGKHSYSIVLTCKDSQGHDRTFDIDPDIYILM